MEPDPSQDASPPSRAWLGAFAHPAFAVVWLASASALIGVAMYDATSGWLMTTLDPHPLAVSLLHAAANLPMFLITLPAGAIADIFDPRRLIVAVSCAIAVFIAMFAGAVYLGVETPALLLLMTFLLSAALSLNSPAWLSILPSLVPKDDLAGAIAANGVVYNVSRTVGPALGGFAIVNLGASAPLWAFAATNALVVAALIWRRPKGRKAADLPAERLIGAVRAGVRHAINNRFLRATLMRTLAVYPFAAAYWGLLPLISRHSGGGAERYGLLLSMVSAGTVFGSLAQRYMRERVNLDWMVAIGTIATAAALLMFAGAPSFPILLGACFLAGAAWVIVLTSLYVSAQNVLPDWVRGRGLAVFLTVIFGAMTVGSASWGKVAAQIGLGQALVFAAIGILAAIPITWPWSLQRGESVDVTPSLHWREPNAAADIAGDRGPVLVKIGYRIDTKDRAAFLRAMGELGEERRGDGAFAWGIFEHMTEFGRFEEGYLIESWLELMRMRERVTVDDLMLEEEIRQMLLEPPHIEFFVASERNPLRRGLRETEAGA